MDIDLQALRLESAGAVVLEEEVQRFQALVSDRDTDAQRVTLEAEVAAQRLRAIISGMYADLQGLRQAAVESAQSPVRDDAVLERAVVYEEEVQRPQARLSDREADVQRVT